jgi:hypothetical protein
MTIIVPVWNFGLDKLYAIGISAVGNYAHIVTTTPHRLVINIQFLLDSSHKFKELQVNMSHDFPHILLIYIINKFKN